MTVQEAIKNVTAYVYMECENMPQQVIKALDVLKDSAKECGRYRALGTVEELKEAREKQVAKKPIGRHTDYKCSVCGRRVRSGKGSSSRQRDNFCQRCGTKIDWEEGAE